MLDATDQNVRFQIRGSTETRTADEKAFVANMPKFEDIPEYRGVKTSILGFATLDRASAHFTEFRLIAAGTRFGARFFTGFSALGARSTALAANPGFLYFGRELPKLPAVILPRRVRLSPLPILLFYTSKKSFS